MNETDAPSAASEVVARLADTVLDITRVPAEGSYRGHDGSMLVVAGKPVVERIRIGLVSYEVRRTAPTRERVARKRIEKRFYPFLAASLVVQLALWLAAATLAPFEKLVVHKPRPLRVAHIQPSEPPPPPRPEPEKPEPPKPAAALHASSEPARRRSSRTPADEVDKLYGDPAAQMAHLAKVMAEIDVAGKLAATDGPLYLPENDDAGFGGTGGHMKYDDTTYKVERWALPTYMHVKGELAPVPAIQWCDDGSCSTRGPLALDRVLGVLIRHEAEIARCYREHTGDLVGNIRVRFPIGADGKVTGALGTETGPVGYGTGTVGRCVAKIAQGIRWPRANDETYVFVGLAFKPAAG